MGNDWYDEFDRRNRNALAFIWRCLVWLGWLFLVLTVVVWFHTTFFVDDRFKVTDPCLKRAASASGPC